ncbi:hypothetical protein KI387_002990, partial [Taxus chinensis]
EIKAQKLIIDLPRSDRPGNRGKREDSLNKSICIREASLYASTIPETSAKCSETRLPATILDMAYQVWLMEASDLDMAYKV